MNYLLDTHIALWLLQGDSRTPQKVIELVLDPRNNLYVSDVSVWEVAIKHMNRPDSLPASGAAFAQACDQAGYRALSLDREAIFEYESLNVERAAGAHKDPFDRMLIAQSKAEGMVLITHDKKLALYGEPLVSVF